MWVATSRAGGAAVQHRLLRYIDERAIHARRWTTALENYPGPTLFGWGPADPVSGAHVLPRLSQRLPRARIWRTCQRSRRCSRRSLPVSHTGPAVKRSCATAPFFA
jgi:hypothetical protein